MSVEPKPDRQGSDPVTGVGDGLDHRRVAELSPQPADRDLDDASVGVDVLVPAAGEQFACRDRCAGGGEQELEHRELLPAQLEPAAGARRDALHGVEPEVAPGEERCASGVAAAGERADAGDELGEGERLGQVVVGAEAEPVDTVFDRVGRGQHEHARTRPACHQCATHVVAVDLGNVAIEQDHFVAVTGARDGARPLRRRRCRRPFLRGASRPQWWRRAPCGLRR